MKICTEGPDDDKQRPVDNMPGGVAARNAPTTRTQQLNIKLNASHPFDQTAAEAAGKCS